MNMQEVKTIAKNHSIKPGKLKKGDLIRLIQKSEGNFQCYASASSGECDQLDCVWRVDCFKDARKQAFA